MAHRRSPTHLILIGCIAMLVGAASTSDLSDRDYRYLAKEFGLKRGETFLQNLDKDARASLHAAVNDPAFGDTPRALYANVGDLLLHLEITTCDGKPKAPTDICPPEPGALPGKKVAQEHCFACHFVGTMEAPSFYKMSLEGKWDEPRLGEALASGHEMSPRPVTPEQLKDLAEYIRSLSR